MSTQGQTFIKQSLVEKILFEYADPVLILDSDEKDLVDFILRHYA